MLEPPASRVELPAIPGKRYFTIGEVSDDCSGCDHLLNASSDIGVICDGLRALGKPRPPQTLVRRPPPEAFEHPEEEDPMQAVGRWLDEQSHVSESR